MVRYKLKESHQNNGILLIEWGAVYKLFRLLFTVLNALPMIGPIINKAAITTMATKTRINAYSTKPWPLSFGENNMAFSPFFRISPVVMA